MRNWTSFVKKIFFVFFQVHFSSLRYFIKYNPRLIYISFGFGLCGGGGGEGGEGKGEKIKFLETSIEGLVTL